MTGEVSFGNDLGVLLLFQTTLCMGVGLGASYLLRTRAARAHQVLVVGLVVSVTLPCLTLLVNHLDLGLFVLQAPAPLHERVFALGSAEGVSGVVPEFVTDSGPMATASTATEPVPVAGPVQESTAPAHLPWETILPVCWVVATAVLVGRLVLRFILGVHLVRTSDELDHEALCRAADAAKARLGIHRSVHVRSSARVSSPILWGWAYEPVVLVPKDAGQHAECEDWMGILCHELAHWKRSDHLSSLLAELVACVVPWHPLVWWARARLIGLSEQVCDDWVLACGQAGVIYAESLLDLSPQRSVTLLPAIVGKGHTMKERIRRIVKEECGDPRVGRQWTLGVGAVAAIIAVSAAFAQPRDAAPKRSPEQVQGREQPDRPDLAVAGRRNVLNRLLEQLRDQLRETEKVLAERPEARGEEAQILRSEREAIREQIKRLEVELRDLNRGPAGPQPEARVARQQAAELSERLRDLRRRAEEIQGQLRGLEDQEGGQARALREELNGVKEKTAATERQMQENRRQPRDPLRRMQDPIRRPGTQVAPEVFERIETRMNREETVVRVYKLRYARPEQLVEIVRPLDAYAKLTPVETTNSLVVSASPEIQDKIAGVIRELDVPGVGPQRERPEVGRGLETQVADLRGQVNGLNEKMQQMQRLLEQLVRQRPEDNQMQQVLEQLLRDKPEGGAKPSR